MYAYNLDLATPPQFVVHGATLADWKSLSDEQRAEIGWLPLIYDPDGALLGYADPVKETRDGQQVAVAYALATPEQEAAHLLAVTNKAAWAAQAVARKDREAKSALALPDSDDPTILRRKLNAALHLIQR